MCKLSVLIPAYNEERHISTCLETLLEQTYHDFEVIVVDDGSTDGTASICSHYSKAFQHFTLVRKRNEGRVEARRTALDHASGEYVVYLDADDGLMPDALAQVAQAINENNADVYIYGYTECSRVYVRGGQREETVGGGDYRKCDFKRELLSGRQNALWNKAIKKSILLECKKDSEANSLSFGEDLYELISVADRVDGATVIDSILYQYHRHEGATTSHYCRRHADDLAVVSRRVMDYGEKWGLRALSTACVLLQCCNLLKELWRDKNYKGKKKEMQYIRAALNELPMDVCLGIDLLRLDNRKIVYSLLKGHYLRAGLIIEFEKLLKDVGRLLACGVRRVQRIDKRDR